MQAPNDPMPPQSRSLLGALEKLLFACSAALVAYAQYHAFMLVPNEVTMGAVQRIFYFHVGSAIACYLAFAVVFVSGLAYLATRKSFFDILSAAAGEVGLLFCTIVLISGMIWARSAWGAWFSFEPRLVTFLLLWIIFVAFVVLRAFGDPQRTPAHAAVLGIVGTIMVPIMVFSIKFLPAIAQQHPQVLARRGLGDPRMQEALIISIIAFTCLQGSLIWLRTRIGLVAAAQAASR
jgi:heme exporter protein C